MIQLYKEKFNLSHILESPLKSVSPSPAHFTRSFSRHNFQLIRCRTSTLLNSFINTTLEFTPRICQIKPLSVTVQIATESHHTITLFSLISSHHQISKCFCYYPKMEKKNKFISCHAMPLTSTF